jgi:DNA replication ATP-dependent helicase Dna2
VQNAVNSDNYYLIDGPPGTGKTHKILKHIIEILQQNYDFNILVAAYTNRAVDEIAEAIQSIDSNTNFIRIGSKEASDDFEHHLPKIIEKYGNNEAYKRLKQTKVIISTVSSLHTNSEIFDLKDFDTLIIDEASQILETYLIGLIIKVRKFILIGDDKQLPPISIQNPNSLICDNPELISIGINNFSNSLFSRLKQICENNNWNNAIGKLSYQARMHNEIQEFPNLHFYENRLIPKKENQFSKIERFDTQAENKIEKILAKNRVIFIECPLDIGKTNKYESEICKLIVETIEQKYELNFELLGIISPFRMQCFELLKNLNEKQKEYINIDTVERYQGSQREFIIMSCSANSEFLLERIKSEDLLGKVDRKLNVAITRAKSHFIMLGNSYYLSKSTHYNNFINYVKSKNSFYYYREII